MARKQRRRATKLGDFVARQAFQRRGLINWKQFEKSYSRWRRGGESTGRHISSRADQPLASGTATKRSEPPERIRINTLFLWSA
jgi:hypothetical protein